MAVITIEGRLAQADAAQLCDRLRAVLQRQRADVVVCDVGAVVAPDAETVDVLARLQLTARRLGHEVRLRSVPCALVELMVLTGLDDVVPREG